MRRVPGLPKPNAPLIPPPPPSHAATVRLPPDPSLSPWRQRRTRTRTRSTPIRTGPRTAPRSPSKETMKYLLILPDLSICSWLVFLSECIQIFMLAFFCVSPAGSVRTWPKIWPSWRRKSTMLLGTETRQAPVWAPPPHPARCLTRRPPPSLPGRRWVML